MADGNDKIDVLISGAVCNAGHHLLTKPATIKLGLDAAGGLASPTSQMRASGDVTVRRPKGPGKVDVWRFKILEASAELQNFELQDGDLVAFRWDIQPLAS